MPTLSRRTSFAVIGVMLLVFFLASAAPSPLYVVYQAEWGFSATTLTTVFAVYVVALLGALLTVGALSDFVGRRPVLAAALALEALSMVLFLAADSVTWLFAARTVQGVATGTAAGALSAALVDLQPPARPRVGSLVNASVPGAGLALGALGSGTLVEIGPSPTTLIFALLTAAFVVLLGAVALIPESEPGRPGALASLRPRVALPRRIRGQFLVVTPSLMATWALGGLYLSLGPSLAASILGLHSHVVGGLVIFTLAAMGSLAALVLRDLTPARTMLTGCWALVLGIGLTLTALDVVSPALFFTGTAIAGIGFGAAFQGAFRTLARLAEPEERAALFATLYTVSYLAFSLPAIAAGFAITSFGLRTTANVYAAAVIVLALSAAAGFALRRRRAERCVAVA